MKPVCPRCKHPGYWLTLAANGRPLFWCDSCYAEWTSGKGGGEWMGNQMGIKKKPTPTRKISDLS